MERKKVNLAWIANDSTRRATFKKRRKGLIKKVSELATLCDVMACIVVYGPQQALPEVWPPSAAKAARVLARFRSMPEMDQCKRMLNQEAFLRLRAAKLQEQLRRQERENRELEMALLMHRGLAGGVMDDDVRMEDVTSLACAVELRGKVVRERIERVKRERTTSAAAVADEAREERRRMVALERQNWLVEAVSDRNDEQNAVVVADAAAHAEEIMTMRGSYMAERTSSSSSSNPWLDPYFLSF